MTPPTVAELRAEIVRLKRAREEIAESVLQLQDDMAEVEHKLRLEQARLDRALAGG